MRVHMLMHARTRAQLAIFYKIFIDDEYGTYWDDEIEFDTNNTISYTPPDYAMHDFVIKRKIEEIEDLENMNFMPGFKLSWYYSGAVVTPEPVDDYYERNKKFMR